MNSLRDSWRSYAAALVLLAAATGVGFILHPFLDPINIALIYLLGVVFCATTWGLGPAILSSVFGVLILHAVFMPPYGLFAIRAWQDIVTFVVFLIVSVIISQLVARIRAQMRVARQREREASALYALNREMAFATSRERVLDAVLNQLRGVFNAEPMVLLTNPRGEFTPYSDRTIPPQALERAHDVLGKNELTRPPHSPFISLKTAQENFGLLGLERRGSTTLSSDEYRLLEAFANQIALALEHIRLNEQAEQARLREAGENFRTALLSSLSHDLRTPLASIIGSVSSLLDETARLDRTARTDLLQTVLEEATRLNRLVSNLLAMTRLEAGALDPHRDWHSVDEVIGAALSHTDTRAHTLNLSIEPALPLVYFDFVLMEQVLVNLVENAVKFSPRGSCIEIVAQRAGDRLHVCVMDRGVGIPNGELERIFEKFYRVPRRNDPPGSGLGLVICRGIVESNGGTIWAEPRAGGGAILAFTLPLGDGEQFNE